MNYIRVVHATSSQPILCLPVRARSIFEGSDTTLLPLPSHLVVSATVHSLRVKVAVLRLDQEHAHPLHDGGVDIDLGTCRGER